MTEQGIDEKMPLGMCVHGNFADRCPLCSVESASNPTPERAREILGHERFFGAERVREIFGIERKEIPEIPFSAADLETAKENDERLVLRVDRFDQETPFTLQELLRRMHKKGNTLFSSTSDIGDATNWVEEMSFYKDKTPKLEWKLIWTKPLHGVRHLSFEAQSAFMDADRERLEQAIDRMKQYWDEILSDAKNKTLQPYIEEAKAALPAVEYLEEIRSRLPDAGTLPSVIEALYDALLIQTSPFDNMSVVTRDTVDPIDDESERPIDLGFVHGLPSLHIRRDKRFGRPHRLGEDDSFVEGIPIGYVQH